MTSWECYENKWFYMKYIGKYLSEEIFLTCECSYQNVAADNFLNISSSYVLFLHTFILLPQTTVPIIKIRYVLKRIFLNSLILNHNGQFFYLIYMTWTVLWWFSFKIIPDNSIIQHPKLVSSSSTNTMQCSTYIRMINYWLSWNLILCRLNAIFILNRVLMTKIYIREQICTCVNLPEIYSRV